MVVLERPNTLAMAAIDYPALSDFSIKKRSSEIKCFCIRDSVLRLM